ncbi:hypothetical protein AG1IA_02847 [Rhizoctonia solani AG-1 IA]|uniref:Uncharacterized protein n=1 Tax=Thanatephorus cucumeris (strain AG1-IA) TaxID=983506 RepID=L8WYF2_THACA|nr:hypothetical protein AG1IA_02847 [Rhizoctonia solani AG-1 IA]
MQKIVLLGEKCDECCELNIEPKPYRHVCKRITQNTDVNAQVFALRSFIRRDSRCVLELGGHLDERISF